MLSGAKLLFASVVAKQMVSCAAQTDVTWVKSDNPVRPKADVTWVKSDNPVRPKAPPPKEAQAGTQTSNTQQTLTKASQVRPGRSSIRKKLSK